MRSCQMPECKWFMILIVLSVLLLVTGGCSKHYTDYEAFVRDPRPLVTATEYRMEPPDAILVQSKRVREINNQSQQIRPDGVITLPLLGSVFVAGKTAEELSAELEQLAVEYYEDADVTVRIVRFASKKIFVFGEVSGPGPYPYSGTNTVLGTLARAQPSRLANVSRIQILRPNSEGELIRRMTINLDDMVKRGDLTLDAVLEEGDIIYVPPNALAAVGLALQQVLLPISPAATVVSRPSSIDSSLNSGPYQNSGGGTQ